MSHSAAIWTMVRNDEVFLKLWIDYYSRFVPRENLYILVDGADSALPVNLHGCQIITFPHIPPGPGWDRKRWSFLSQFVSALTYRFEVVIGGDVDELIVLDPLVGNNPIQYILQNTYEKVISPFAIEVVHRLDIDQPLDNKRPILEQRTHGRTKASYCKPCITRTPINWSLGQHYSNYPTLHLSSDLFLFHLRFFDREILLERQKLRYQHTINSEADIVQGVAGAGWMRTVAQVDAQLRDLAEFGPPETTDFSFKRFRRKIEKRWRFEEKRGIWKHANFVGQKTFVIPERFRSIF